MTPADIAERLFRYQAAARARGAYTDCACPSEDEVADAIAEACGAALRERDAAHEIALKKARADALVEAARVCEEQAAIPGTPFRSAMHDRVAAALRALLEEAGK